MSQRQNQLAALHEIRTIMDRASWFIALSGLAGLAAGVAAFVGAAVVKGYLVTHDINYRQYSGLTLPRESIIYMISVAALMFILAFYSAAYFTPRNAQKSNQRVWDNETERMLVKLFIPLAAGGIFCAVLIFHNLLSLVAPVVLVFCGCALLNASK